jgi:hypothetical protein
MVLPFEERNSHPRRPVFFLSAARLSGSQLALARLHLPKIKKAETEKADVMERPQAFDHIGLLVNHTPLAGCYCSSHPTTSNRLLSRAAFRFPTGPPNREII